MLRDTATTTITIMPLEMATPREISIPQIKSISIRSVNEKMKGPYSPTQATVSGWK